MINYPPISILYVLIVIIVISIAVIGIFIYKKDKKRLSIIANYLNFTFESVPTFIFGKKWIAQSPDNRATLWISRFYDSEFILYIRFNRPLPFRFYIYSAPDHFIPSDGYRPERPYNTRIIKKEGLRIYVQKDKYRHIVPILNNMVQDLKQFKRTMQGQQFQLDRNGLKVFIHSIKSERFDLEKIYKNSLLFMDKLEHFLLNN